MFLHYRASIDPKPSSPLSQLKCSLSSSGDRLEQDDKSMCTSSFRQRLLSWQLAIVEAFPLQKFNMEKKFVTGFPGQGWHFGRRISQQRQSECPNEI